MGVQTLRFNRRRNKNCRTGVKIIRCVFHSKEITTPYCVRLVMTNFLHGKCRPRTGSAFRLPETPFPHKKTFQAACLKGFLLATISERLHHSAHAAHSAHTHIAAAVAARAFIFGQFSNHCVCGEH